MPLDDGYLFSGNNTQAAMEGEFNATRLRNMLAQEKERAIARQVAQEEEFDPTQRAIASRKADLEYEQLLPTGSTSSIRAEVPTDGYAGMGSLDFDPRAATGMRAIESPAIGERPVGLPSIGQERAYRERIGAVQAAHPNPAGDSGVVDTRVTAIEDYGRKNGLSPRQIQDAINRMLRERTLHGALGKGDYGTAGHILYPEAFRNDPLGALR